MSVEMDVVYSGELQCQATHGPSGCTLVTDAPVDNGGRGAAFSPTDLVGAALGACMLTIMDKVCARHGWALRGTRVRVVKEMIAAPQRRIAALRTTITLPPGRSWSAEDRQRLESAAHACPVKASLHPDVALPVEFIYPA
jgi:putative redox protein